MPVEVLVDHQETLRERARLEEFLLAFARHLEDLRGERDELGKGGEVAPLVTAICHRGVQFGGCSSRRLEADTRDQHGSARRPGDQPPYITRRDSLPELVDPLGAVRDLLERGGEPARIARDLRADAVGFILSAARDGHLHERGEKILWAPDKHLGHYVERVTGAEMLLWPGACVVHEEFKSVALERLRRLHPEAAVLVHPESPDEVVDQADVVGSTTRLIQAVREMPNTEFIVATDEGIFWKMHQLAPDKKLIAAPTAGAGATCESCAHCPWMGMNSLINLAQVLESGSNEILIDPAIRERAVRPIQRMLDFAREHGISGKLPGNA